MRPPILFSVPALLLSAILSTLLPTSTSQISDALWGWNSGLWPSACLPAGTMSISTRIQFRTSDFWPSPLVPAIRACALLSGIAECSGVGNVPHVQFDISSSFARVLLYDEQPTIKGKHSIEVCFNIPACDFGARLRDLGMNIDSLQSGKLSLHLTVSGLQGLPAAGQQISVILGVGGGATTLPITAFDNAAVQVNGALAVYRSHTECTSESKLTRCVPHIAPAKEMEKFPSADAVRLDSGRLECLPVGIKARDGHHLLLNYFNNTVQPAVASTVLISSMDSDISGVLSRDRQVNVDLSVTLPSKRGLTCSEATTLEHTFEKEDQGWLHYGFTPLKVCATLLNFASCSAPAQATLNLYLSSKHTTLPTEKVKLGDDVTEPLFTQTDGKGVICRSFSYCEIAEKIRSLKLPGGTAMTPFLRLGASLEFRNLQSVDPKNVQINIHGSTIVLNKLNNKKKALYTNIKGPLVVLRSDCATLSDCPSYIGTNGPSSVESMQFPADGKQDCVPLTAGSTSLNTNWQLLSQFEDTYPFAISSYQPFSFPDVPKPDAQLSSAEYYLADQSSRFTLQSDCSARQFTGISFLRKGLWASGMLTPLKVCLHRYGVTGCTPPSAKAELALSFAPSGRLTSFKSFKADIGQPTNEGYCVWWSLCELHAALAGVQRDRLKEMTFAAVLRVSGLQSLIFQLTVLGNVWTAEDEYLDREKDVQGPISIVYPCRKSDSPHGCDVPTIPGAVSRIAIKGEYITRCVDDWSHSASTAPTAERYVKSMEDRNPFRFNTYKVVALRNKARTKATLDAGMPAISSSGVLSDPKCENIYTFSKEVVVGTNWTQRAVTPLKVCGTALKADQCLMTGDAWHRYATQTYRVAAVGPAAQEILPPHTRFYLTLVSDQGIEVVLLRNIPKHLVKIGDGFSVCVSLTHSDIVGGLAHLSTMHQTMSTPLEIKKVKIKASWLMEGMLIHDNKLTVTVAGHSVVVSNANLPPKELRFEGPVSIIRPFADCSDVGKCDVTLKNGPPNERSANLICGKFGGAGDSYVCKTETEADNIDAYAATDFVTTFSDSPTADLGHPGEITTFGTATDPVELLYGFEKRLEDRKRRDKIRQASQKKREIERLRLAQEREAELQLRNEAVARENQRLAKLYLREAEVGKAVAGSEERKRGRVYVESGLSPDSAAVIRRTSGSCLMTVAAVFTLGHL